MGIEVYVGQLSGNVTEDEVRKLFKVAGTVTSVHLVTDSGTGEYRGCGYVRMSTEDEAEEAISLLDGALLGDRLIVVKAAPPKQGKNPGSSSGGRSGRTGRGVAKVPK
jgi:RNA recognition motif-containing protein